MLGWYKGRDLSLDTCGRNSGISIPHTVKLMIRFWLVQPFAAVILVKKLALRSPSSSREKNLVSKPPGMYCTMVKGFVLLKAISTVLVAALCECGRGRDAVGIIKQYFACYQECSQSACGELELSLQRASATEFDMQAILCRWRSKED